MMYLCEWVRRNDNKTKILSHIALPILFSRQLLLTNHGVVFRIEHLDSGDISKETTCNAVHARPPDRYKAFQYVVSEILRLVERYLKAAECSRETLT